MVLETSKSANIIKAPKRIEHLILFMNQIHTLQIYRAHTWKPTGNDVNQLLTTSCRTVEMQRRYNDLHANTHSDINHMQRTSLINHV